ncbi:alpha/beta fold hydrolase [Bacillus sp. S/N-304-OC-R1]|uniref:alpha/beta fold hydrolase n=1 Tax=Bacillus sp. S/N-304-OC-R1 TaxID=2758034 RepID=UPI001C8E1BB7|nr:alpha/beta hydrolase [Bacillus sp. S/N-304-OC-R1]MBY0122807.1 alpha/beta hydrolase [Bacillus sp. S/N-304-OC-R1]
MISRKVKADEIEIQIYECGNKTGEAILFLHPQGSSSKIWEKALPAFIEDYHIILMDLRGHGGSDKPAYGYDIQSQCRDIKCVLEELGKQKAHLVGSSLGGDIATAFASIYPENIISLTNIDSGMINYIGQDGERHQTIEEVLEEFKNRQINSFSSKAELLEYAESVFPKEMWDFYFEEWFKFVSLYEVAEDRISYQIPPYINVQIMEMVCNLQYKELYKNITCPILFLPAEKEDHLAIKLKNIDEAKKQTFVKTSIIPGSKHLMILDQSEEVCQNILDFLLETKN